MKTKLLLISALLTSPALLPAQGSSYSITLDFPYVSDYVFRGIKYAGDSIQPSVEFTADKFYIGVWTNQPVTKHTANEFDFYMGYGIPLSDTWTLDLGGTYYYYPETSANDEQIEPYIGLSGDLASGLSSSFYAYYETEFEALTLQGSLGYSFELAGNSTFDVSADLGNVSVSGPGDYTYWNVSGTLNKAFNDKASGYVGVVYTSNDIRSTGSGSPGDDNVYLITGVSVGF